MNKSSFEASVERVHKDVSTELSHYEVLTRLLSIASFNECLSQLVSFKSTSAIFSAMIDTNSTACSHPFVLRACASVCVREESTRIGRRLTFSRSLIYVPSLITLCQWFKTGPESYIQRRYVSRRFAKSSSLLHSPLGADPAVGSLNHYPKD